MSQWKIRCNSSEGWTIWTVSYLHFLILTKSLTVALCLQGGNHGLFGNSTAQSRGMHTPVQPLNSSPSLRAQVPPQFISPQVSNCVFPHSKVNPIQVVDWFCGHKGNNSSLKFEKSKCQRSRFLKQNIKSYFFIVLCIQSRCFCMKSIMVIFLLHHIFF